MTRDADLDELTRLRNQVQAEIDAEPAEPEELLEAYRRIEELQQKLAETVDLMQRYRLEQEISGVHQSLSPLLRDYEERRRTHRTATEHAQRHLQRAAGEVYARQRHEAMMQIEALAAEAMGIATALESTRQLFEEQYRLRGSSGFANNRLRRLLEDALRVATEQRDEATTDS
jgi:hypothetical protein